MEKYDLVVIGAGPAGYAATMRALDLDADARVLLVERGKIGGAGVWNGALSSKTMWELSKDITKLGIRDRGYRVNDFALSYKDIVHCINEAVEERTGHLVHQLRLLEQQVSKRFRLVQGFARLQDAHQVHIQLADGTQEVVQAAHIINKGEQLIPFEDEDIMHVVAQNLEERGVVIHRNSQLQEMKVVDGKVQYTLSLADGTTLTNTVEKALISVGRVTNLEGMGLREIGLDIDARGNFVIEDTQTNLPNIYAIGDLTAEIQLVNVAEMEGRHASERIFGRQRVALSYDNISTIMFLSPEVAGVGINEKQARQMGIPYRIASYSYGYIPRAIAMRNSNGFFKLIVTDDDEMRLLGMRAVGAQASSTIEAAALLIAMKRGIDELANLIHPHPSITEGIQECARMLKGNSIVKPHLFAANIRCSRYVNGQCIDIIPKVATP
jgi:pyruvate/2-oxoglutarate dehydrogenase complex dihydrolipoamide dehydrogenase (E3) component